MYVPRKNHVGWHMTCVINVMTYVDICRMPLNFLTVAYDDICYIGNNSQNILCAYLHIYWHINPAYFMCWPMSYVNIINICHVSRKEIICVDTWHVSEMLWHMWTYVACHFLQCYYNYNGPGMPLRELSIFRRFLNTA